MSQRLLWLTAHYRGHEAVLSFPRLYRLAGPLSLPHLEAACQALCRRHEILRTTFAGGGRGLTQVIHPEDVVAERMRVVHHQVSSEEQGEQAIRAASLRPLDERTWPVGLTVTTDRDEDHFLCVNLHHLVTDGWSNGIFLAELGKAYTQLVGGTAITLPELGWQYRQFSQWQRQRLGGERPARLVSAWLDKLEGAPCLALPTPATRQPVAKRRAMVEEVAIAPEETAGLKALARAERATLFAVLLALFDAAIGNLADQDDITVASLFANRARAEVMHTMGFFSNVVLLRTCFDPRGSFSELVGEAGRTVTHALANQELPLQMLPADRLPWGRSESTAVLFELLPGQLVEPKLARLALSRVGSTEGMRARFDLEFAFFTDGQRLHGIVRYATDRFARTWVRELCRLVEGLAKWAVADPSAPLARLVSRAA